MKSPAGCAKPWRFRPPETSWPDQALASSASASASALRSRPGRLPLGALVPGKFQERVQVMPDAALADPVAPVRAVEGLVTSGKSGRRASDVSITIRVSRRR
ncbi:MAG: hypothetical protein ACJ8AW_50515 [Rhodopila sp.]